MGGSGEYEETSVTHDHMIAGIKTQLMIIGGWAKTFFICILLMLGIYVRHCIYIIIMNLLFVSFLHQSA